MIPNMQSTIKQFSDAEIAQLAMDPHNIVHKHASDSKVPLDQRVLGAEMKATARKIWDEFKPAFVEHVRLDQVRCAEVTGAAPQSSKALTSHVRHLLCKEHPEWGKVWKTQPRVFCKLTSPYTTQEEFELMLEMYDIRIKEDDGVYSDKHMTDNVLKQLLMTKLAKHGTFEDLGITAPKPAPTDLAVQD